MAAGIQTGPHAGLPPGLYASTERKVALNVIAADTVIAAANWPAGTVVDGIEMVKAQALKGLLLSLAMVLLAADVLAALWLSGRLGRAARVLPLILAVLFVPHQGRAQTPEDLRGIDATRGVVLAHVLTGNAEVDRVAQAGLYGLGETLWQRTSIEPEPPMGVDIEKDDLAFFPFLYWPITPDQPIPSQAAYNKLNRFLRTGGMILFDTRDGDIAGLSDLSLIHI